MSGLKVTARTRDVERLKQVFKNLEPDSKLALESALLHSVTELVEKANALVPVDTGNLLRSIDVKKTRNKTGVPNFTVSYVFSKAPYAALVHEGTEKMKKRPWLRKAYSSWIKSAPKKILLAYRKILTNLQRKQRSRL